MINQDPLLPGDLIAFSGSTSCRSWLLLLFVLVCSAVVGIDRYLTVDSVRLCMDGNKYNNEELAHIRETQIAQVSAGNYLRYVAIFGDNLARAEQANKVLSGISQRLLKENLELNHCQRVISNYNDKLIQTLLDKGLELPIPDAEPTLTIPPPVSTAEPIEADRST